jgi:23S rRNA (uracil1939-C5)-methyltransferase
MRAGLRLAEIDELELAIEKLVAGGDGMGRFEGIPIFVPRSAPGDRARVRLVERRPGYGRAEIVELLAPGPGRRDPPCPHFGVCGGCDLQHLEDRLQTRLKAEALEETLRRLSGLALPRPSAVLSGESWGYRLRTQVHTRRAGDGVQVGYYQRRSRDLVAVRACPILRPELEREVVTLARRLPSDAPARIDLTLGDDERLSTAPPVSGLPQGEISRRVAGFDYTFDARCFFQGHAGLLDALADAVVGDEEGELAIDLYGGVGLFALPLARHYRRVVTVEGDRVASRFARRNARANRCAGVEAVNQAVESWVVTGLPDGADRVVVDPPRDGLSTTVRGLLAARAPRRLTYVSCHPAALARDLRELAPRFAVESIVLVDLFPQTGHMEAVAQLVARGAEPRE